MPRTTLGPSKTRPRPIAFQIIIKSILYLIRVVNQFLLTVPNTKFLCSIYFWRWYWHALSYIFPVTFQKPAKVPVVLKFVHTHQHSTGTQYEVKKRRESQCHENGLNKNVVFWFNKIVRTKKEERDSYPKRVVTVER